MYILDIGLNYTCVYPPHSLHKKRIVEQIIMSGK